MSCTNQNINKASFRTDFNKLLEICSQVADIEICLNELGQRTGNTAIDTQIEKLLNLSANVLNDYTTTVQTACDTFKNIDKKTEAACNTAKNIYRDILSAGGTFSFDFLSGIDSFYKDLILGNFDVALETFEAKIKSIDIGFGEVNLCKALDVAYDCYVGFLQNIPQNCMNKTQRAELTALLESSPSQLCQSVIDIGNKGSIGNTVNDVLSSLANITGATEILNQFITGSGLTPAGLTPQNGSLSNLLNSFDDANSCSKIGAAVGEYANTSSIGFYANLGCALFDLYKFYSGLDFNNLFNNLKGCISDFEADYPPCEIAAKFFNLKDLTSGQPFQLINNITKFCNIADAMIKLYGRKGFQTIYNNVDDNMLYNKAHRTADMIDFINKFYANINTKNLNPTLNYYSSNINPYCVNLDVLIKNLSNLLPKKGTLQTADYINLSETFINNTACLSNTEFDDFMNNILIITEDLPNTKLSVNSNCCNKC